jgi:hypothetical protein
MIHTGKDAASLPIREMLIKTTLRYHPVPVRMPSWKIQKIMVVRTWKLELLCPAGGNVKWYSCWKQYGGFSKKQVKFPWDPAIPLLGKIQKNWKQVNFYKLLQSNLNKRANWQIEKREWGLSISIYGSKSLKSEIWFSFLKFLAI